ncbi:hypothetical protein Clacol_008750 [Clathrus columnatus]|uniref:Peptidase A1 domain-containing protein n=1 Tax=Clathrus columnatus TaxID=1419009 RepID=A0AAV5ANL5_9AGAM|nr:hypothetical protein Clacol_008750 [Clathrus columnatus]
MPCKAFIFALIFCLSATVNAVEQTAKGIRIDLPKRSSLTKADGTFDYERAIIQSRITAAKHRQNLINIGLNLQGIGPIELERRQSEPLTDSEGDNTEWLGNIAIGTPGQTFLVDFDITVAGVVATNQFFSPVTTLSDEFEGDQVIDGILGMAFPALSGLGQNPFFITAFSQGAVPLNEFGFKLSANPDDSSIFLGGVDDSLFTGPVEFHDISDNRGYWEIGNASIAVGSMSIMSGFQTIIDSWDGENSWPISSENLNLGAVEEGSSDCLSAIAGEDFGLGDNVWLLGDRTSTIDPLSTARASGANSIPKDLRKQIYLKAIEMAPLLLKLHALSISTTVASPVTQPAGGSSIDLPKRRSLTKADGVFDRQEAIEQTSITVAKHRQNLINIQCNLEGGCLNQRQRAKAVVYKNLQNRQLSESLINQEDSSEWVGNIAIGTPDQPFLIDFDTGSADLWVPSSSCTSLVCSGRNKYNANSSSTAISQPGRFGIEYGDESTVLGGVETDTVTVAGVVVTNQFFSPVTTLSDQFAGKPFDGFLQEGRILGMALPALATLNGDPFFVTAYKQGVVPKNEFAFKLASSGSSLYLGGTDASGTTLIYGAPSHVETLYSKIPGSGLLDPEQLPGFYTFPCLSVPSVSFSWGGKSWPISSSNFNLGSIEEGSPYCVGAIVGQDIGLGENVWLLGDRFMQNVYTVFSFEENAVGFANLS